MKPFYKYLILLTLILTSFALWVVYADNIRKIIVKNILNNNNISIFNDKNNDDISRTNVFTDKLEKSWIIEKNNLDLEIFWEVYSTIKKEYYDLEWLKKQDLIDWASKWLVNALWDKHSELMTKKENKEFHEMLAWDFEWIWAFVDKLGFWVKIERIINGSPAQKYWVMKDDVIIEANGVKLAELSLYNAVAKIKWPAGTKVDLKILRIGEKAPINILVIRWKVKIPSVEEKIFEEENKKIWYIALSMFWNTTADEFKKVLKNLEKKKIDWLIIDLRNNWWGLLFSAVEILSEFVQKWEILVTTKYKNKWSNQVYPSLWFNKRFDKKIVILINGSSASASEITAGALKDYKKAIIVWEKSYWKWSVQSQFDFKNWSMLKLTIAKWFTPLDKNIDWEWIKPDIKVEIKKQDYNLEECIKVWKCDKKLKQKDFKIYDRQLEEAKNILIKFIKKETLQVVIDEENERLGNKIEEEKK